MNERICIGVATSGDVKAEMMVSLITMTHHSRLPFVLSMRKGCYVHENREMIVKDALENNCTHLLFVDSDMKFPQDTLLKLLKHGKDIVGASYNGRTTPRKSLVLQWVGDALEPIKTLPDA